jgi:very-short-patch-repair endonuclease
VWVADEGRADLADAALRLVVECESFAHHSSRRDFTRDIRRYTAFVRLGWWVVRFGWEEAMHDPAYVRAVLEDVVRRATRQAVRERCTCPAA